MKDKEASTKNKKVYFIRHGESELNVARLAGGHTDTPLTPRGKMQAAEAGKTARDEGLVFDVILSSPLSRAHHTAQAIAEHTNYPQHSIELRDDLKERNFGDLEAKHFERDFNVALETYIYDPFALDHIPNIEKITDLQYRANKVYEELLQRPEKTILVVGHGAFARSLQRTIKNAPLTEYVKPYENAVMVKII